MKIKLQRDDAINVFIRAFACASIPVLGCILYCAFQGQPISNLYLPNTEDLDDILYYKMVEGMVEFGAPLGYFGYNESHALVSAFGVWSPILLMPWALWGKIFGWGYSSPMACNIFMISLAFAIFAILAKPTWKQIISIALLFLSVVPFTRYVLSGRPEIIGYSLTIIIFGVVYSYFQRETTGKLIWIFGIITLLCLMRPYFIVFLLLPGILWVRRSKTAGLIGTALVVLFNLLEYIFMTHFFSAPYFYSSMENDFVEAFRSEGFFAGCLFLFHKIYDRWITIRWLMSKGVRLGFTDGQLYFACCVAMLFLFIWGLSDIIKARNQKESINRDMARNIVLEVYQLISTVIMLLAIMILYHVAEGSRHIMVFLLGFIFVGAMRDNYSLEKNILILAAFLYLFIIKYDEPSGYCVAYSNGDIIQEIEGLENKFSACIHLNYTDAPSYDNVVIWVTGEDPDGEEREMYWKALSALPDGVGISTCVPQYLTENIDNLNSRYIIAVSGGQIDLLCREKGMELLMKEEDFALYRTH